MGSQVNLRAVGLNYSPNNLALPEGSLSIANDVIIRRDNVLESRRGFRNYSEAFGQSSDRSLQLISYKERILNHYKDSSIGKSILQYDTGAVVNERAVFDDFNGYYEPVEEGLRIKSIEANRNLYFTTSEGIKKLAVASASAINANSIKDAGAVKAVDFSAVLDITQGQQTGFLGFDSAVAYRVLWGYKDANENLILGAPSNAVSVYNYLYKTSALDINALCIALDNLKQSNQDYHSVIHNIYTDAEGNTFPQDEGFSTKYYCPETISASDMKSNVSGIATSLDRFSLLGDISETYYAKPLKVSTVSVENKEATITFENENVSTFSDGVPIAPYGMDYRPNTSQIFFADVTSGLGRVDEYGAIVFYQYGTDYTLPSALSSIRDLVFDLSGNLYICDTGNNRIVKFGFSGNSITTSSVFVTGVTSPQGITIDSLSNLYVCCGSSVPRIVKISQSGVITEISNPSNEELRMLDPYGIDVDMDDNLYVSDAGANVIKKLTDVASRAATTVSASPTVTMTDTSNLQVGMYVYGTNIPSGARISAITTNVSITLTANATAGGSTTLTFSKNISIFSGNAPVVKTGCSSTGTNTITVLDATSLRVGMNVYGLQTGLSVFQITSIVGTAVTVSGIVPAGTNLSFSFIAKGNFQNGFNQPAFLKVDQYGGIYISEIGNNIIKKLDSTGAADIIAGKNAISLTGSSDGTNKITVTNNASIIPGMLVTGDGALIPQNTFIGTLDGTTKVNLVNSSGGAVPIPVSSAVNFSFISKGLVNGKGDVARFNYPTGIAIGPNSEIYVAELENDTIRKLTAVSPQTIFGVSDKIEILGGSSTIATLNNKDEDNFRYYSITNVNGNSISFAANISDIATIRPNLEFNIYSYEFRNILNVGQADVTSSNPRTLSSLNSYNVPETPTNITYATIMSAVFAIISKLKSLTSTVRTNYITQSLQDQYLLNLNITQAGNVKLVVNIPETIQNDTDYFFQVYRTANFIALDADILGTTLTPDDEMRLVYEAFPTASERSALKCPFIDSYPSDLRGFSTNLYTNPASGEGINQSNNIPPIAKDINYFKNVAFYANTKTRHRLVPFNLLGTSNINNGDTILITDGTQAQTREYTFVLGSKETSTFTFNDWSFFKLKNRLFTINSAKNEKRFYFWYRYNNKDVEIYNIICSPTQTRLVLADSDNLQYINFENFVNIDSENSQLSGLKLLSGGFSGSGGYSQYILTENNGGSIVLNNAISFSSVTPGGSTTFVTSTPHGLSNGDGIYIGNVVSDNNLINKHHEVSVINPTSFSVPVPTTVITAFANARGLPSNLLSLIPSATYLDENGDIQERIGIAINISDEVAIPIINRTIGVVNSQSSYFTASYVNANKFIIENTQEGITDNATAGTLRYFPGNFSEYNISIIPGDGEDIANGKILLSQADLRSQAIDLTARSIVAVINGDANSPVYAYYASDSTTLPGIMNLESKVQMDERFYVMGSTYGVGISFNPDIGPYNSPDQNGLILPTSAYITSIVSGGLGSGYSTVTTYINHGLQNGNIIIISNSGMANVNGIYTVSNITDDTFRINKEANFNVTTGAAWSLRSDTTVSTNEEKINRVYYSKYLQPEAVPLLNSIDVGSADRKILRIFPLRDSLFVFKEDGLFRISGETAPFVLSLFDTSCVLISPDSVAVANNIVYCWTTKGISNVTEAGVTEISRPIDTEVLKLASSNYPNFNKLTWGVGYDSDNSYTVYTNSSPSDLYATKAFRYSNLTNTWTNFNRSQTCGIINLKDDKIYTGSGVANLIQQERKSFDNTDYADDDFVVTVVSFTQNVVELSSVDDITIGDVFQQNGLEAVITAVNGTSKKITLNSIFNITVGNPAKVFKAIPCKVQYSPVTFGDPLKLKQIYEATIMFNDRSFTKAKASFSSDLVPMFYDIEFPGDGHNTLNTNAAPFRTIVPRNSQRCRFINVVFEHNIAREKWSMYGITLTGNATESTRAYR